MHMDLIMHMVGFADAYGDAGGCRMNAHHMWELLVLRDTAFGSDKQLSVIRRPSR